MKKTAIFQQTYPEMHEEVGYKSEGKGKESTYNPILDQSSRDLTRIVKQTQSLEPAAVHLEGMPRGGKVVLEFLQKRGRIDIYRKRLRTVRRTNRVINFLTAPARTGPYKTPSLNRTLFRFIRNADLQWHNL